jgi:hypothetical protein
VAEIELPDPDELEERRDKTFSRRVALLTAIYAIVLAFASLGGANALERIALNQAASRPMLFFSLVLAALGAASTVNGYVLLVRLSLLH